jgi:hypothetical protein
MFDLVAVLDEPDRVTALDLDLTWTVLNNISLHAFAPPPGTVNVNQMTRHLS